MHEHPADAETLAAAAAPAPSTGGDGAVDELATAVAALPENQKRALLLREWRGLSYQEIATELAVSHTAVEMLLFRARRAVAGRLKQSAAAPARSLVAGLPFLELLRGARETLAALGTAKAAATVVAAVAAPAVTVGVIAQERGGDARAPAISAAAAGVADGAPDPRHVTQRTVRAGADQGSRVEAARDAARAEGRRDASRAAAPEIASGGAAAGAGGGAAGAGNGASEGSTGGVTLPTLPPAPDAAPPPVGGTGESGGSGGVPDEPTGGTPPRGGKGAATGATPATPAIPATPATPHGPATPASPAMPATPGTPPAPAKGETATGGETKDSESRG
jgi:hypothetical protein